MNTTGKSPADTADLSVFTDGRAGRITLTRLAAMNALTHEMCLAIDAALVAWRADPAIEVVIIDAAGERAFCAGGDIQVLYEAGLRGDHDTARAFWRDEYRMNARLAAYPKPIVCFMQGITMGGGVGLGCHVAHRIVGATSRIALPECAIGLVPDVGSSHLLARSPGRIGEYLALSGARMAAADAIFTSFADSFVAEGDWPALKAEIAASGRTDAISAVAAPSGAGNLRDHRAELDRHFALGDVAAICRSLSAASDDFAKTTLAQVSRASPLAADCALRILDRLRPEGSVVDALELEYRFTHRSLGQSDFLEGIRAAVIDKDRNPQWQTWPPGSVERMLAPLGPDGFEFQEE